MNDFAARVLAWFDQHGRKDLPWQQASSAYRVWVSEIMLQQTQVATVIPYFERFMQRFPDVAALAQASQDEALHHWSGLGYYARARNLHKTAGIVHQHYQGQFPQDREALEALPGIGRSTAGAILALVHGQRQAILDGNVKRVLARYDALEGWPGQAAVAQQLWRRAEQLTPERRVGAYTQAMMDLGATVCTRSKPACERCPLNADCAAQAQGAQSAFPHAKPRKQLPQREVVMLMARNTDGEILLQRRAPSGLWGGLWSFPEFESSALALAWCEQQLGMKPLSCEPWPVVLHTFSHFRLHITPLHVCLDNPDNRVMEAPEQLWYNTRSSLRGGFAAPVSRLLDTLLSAQEGAADVSHGQLRQIR